MERTDPVSDVYDSARNRDARSHPALPSLRAPLLLLVVTVVCEILVIREAGGPTVNSRNLASLVSPPVRN